MKFPEKLTALLKKSGKSQSQMERETGIPQATISRFTLGKSRPFMDQAFMLARALNVPLDFLADDDLDEVPTGLQLSDTERVALDLLKALDLSKSEALRRLATRPPLRRDEESLGKTILENVERRKRAESEHRFVSRREVDPEDSDADHEELVDFVLHEDIEGVQFSTYEIDYLSRRLDDVSERIESLTEEQRSIFERNKKWIKDTWREYQKIKRSIEPLRPEDIKPVEPHRPAKTLSTVVIPKKPTDPKK